MALRLMLLTLVALMSFDLPSARDVESWSDGGSRWLGARMADLARLGTEVERSFAGVDAPEPKRAPAPTADPLAVEIASIRADLAFEAAMDGLAADFRADLAAIEAALPVADEAPVLLTVAAPPTDPIVEQPQPSCFDHEAEVAGPGDHWATIVEADSPVVRLTSAVRLTRQALSAWAALIPPATDSIEEDAR